MNEFENNLVQTLMAGLHDFELKMTGTIAEIRGDIKTLTQSNERSHEALQRTVEDNIKTDTKRLDKHSAEIDDNRENITKLLEWKDASEKGTTRKLVVWNSITVVVAVVLAYALTKLG